MCLSAHWKVVLIRRFDYEFKGCVMLIAGPTLLDLQQLTHSTIEQINYIFSISAAGYVTGTILSKPCCLRSYYLDI